MEVDEDKMFGEIVIGPSRTIMGNVLRIFSTVDAVYKTTKRRSSWQRKEKCAKKNSVKEH